MGKEFQNSKIYDVFSISKIIIHFLYFLVAEKNKLLTYLYTAEKEIHILHLFESFHVYIKIYLSDPNVEENPVATSLFKTVSWMWAQTIKVCI